MLKSVGVWAGSALRHASHHSGGIHLPAGTRSGQVGGHLGRHARLSPGLACIVNHAGRSHGVAGMHTSMLLHGWMEIRSHTRHHA